MIKINVIKLLCHMKLHGINQKMLIEKSGLSKPCVRDIMRGKTCRLESAGKIARAVGLNLADLLIVGGQT